MTTQKSRPRQTLTQTASGVSLLPVSWTSTSFLAAVPGVASIAGRFTCSEFNTSQGGWQSSKCLPGMAWHTKRRKMSV